MVLILFLFVLLSSSSSSHASHNVNDFCVADLNGPDSPSGYPCKPPEKVTAEDFKLSGFVAGSTSNPFKTGVTMAFVQQFPAVNGLGISVARVDMDRGGIVPMHTHPGGTELIIMVEGSMTVGFVTSSNLTSSVAYVNTLKPGDIMVIPQGLLHYNQNAGKGKTVSFAAYSSANPRVHLLPILLYANNLTTATVAQTAVISEPDVRRNKARFGGSG